MSDESGAKPPVQRVRIAVVMGSDGLWAACGWADGDDESLMDVALEQCEQNGARYWVEADLPLPTAATIRAHSVSVDEPNNKNLNKVHALGGSPYTNLWCEVCRAVVWVGNSGRCPQCNSAFRP